MVLPVVFLVVMVVAQMLSVARDASALTAATRAAARQAIVGADHGELVAAAMRERRLDPARFDLRVQAGGPGDWVSVTATYRAPTDVPIVGRLVGDVDLRERLVVLVE